MRSGSNGHRNRRGKEREREGPTGAGMQYTQVVESETKMAGQVRGRKGDEEIVSIYPAVEQGATSSTRAEGARRFECCKCACSVEQ
jgi:hypothetical protein